MKLMIPITVKRWVATKQHAHDKHLLNIFFNRCSGHSWLHDTLRHRICRVEDLFSPNAGLLLGNLLEVTLNTTSLSPMAIFVSLAFFHSSLVLNYSCVGSHSGEESQSVALGAGCGLADKAGADSYASL